MYVDNAIDEPTLIRNNENNEFDDIFLINISHRTLNSELTDDNHAATKAYVDSLSESDRNRRYFSLVFDAQDNEFDINKLRNPDDFTVKRNPTSDNELPNKEYIDDNVGNRTLVRFSQTLEKYETVSVGDSVYNLTKYKRINYRYNSY